MREFVSAQQMQESDRRTMQKLRLDSYALMQKVTDEMLDYFSSEALSKKDILFLCGPGNNGGDGYSLAEKLKTLGRKVWIFEVLKPRSNECIRAAKKSRGTRILDLGSFLKKKKSHLIIVDAIFGYQGRSDLPGPISKLLEKVNVAKAFRIALDLPTGIESDTGRFHQNSFLADLSLCVGFPKMSFLNEAVAEFLGQVVWIGDFFVRPKNISTQKFFAIEKEDFIFSNRSRASHKSQFGKCGIIGGSFETPGAAFLAAEAAHRVGAGYVNLFLARSQKFEFNLKTASFLFKKNWKPADLKGMSSLVIGCGGAPKKFDFKSIRVPAVLDADMLQDLKAVQKISAPLILTPHPGEAARMLKTDTQKILKNRIQSLDELVEKSRQAVYLKGAPGILKFYKDQNYYVNLSINPIFAKAGSGDILSGILGGFLAQRPRDFKSTILSGLIFQQTLGEVMRDQRASIASDQLLSFSEAFKRLK